MDVLCGWNHLNLDWNPASMAKFELYFCLHTRSSYFSFSITFSLCVLNSQVYKKQKRTATGLIANLALYVYEVCIFHRRRNREGTGGTCPPNLQGKGAECPHSQSNACSCSNRPDYEISYKISRISSYRVCSGRLTVRFFIVTTKKLLPQWPSSIINAK